MSSVYGERIKLSIFGQSHGPAIGMTLDGVPAGLKVDEEKLRLFMSRRSPGKSPWATGRNEEDKVEFLAGVLDGFTCGAPITAIIHNHNANSVDYKDMRDCPRPGHADYTADIKYGGFQDFSGGGHFSGRLTAPLCIAGGLCKQWLGEMGIEIGAHISAIGCIEDEKFNSIKPDLSLVTSHFPVLSQSVAEAMQQKIAAVHADGDSVGGSVECAVTGLPAGVGEPMFGGIESRISSIVFGIPAVKAIGFGAGFYCGQRLGSENNDPYTIDGGHIKCTKNAAGGILGGITNGMPLIFEVVFKPTPSISLPQQSVSLSTGEIRQIEIRGRHDPCIVPRAVPVVEAAAAVALFDMVLGNTQAKRRKSDGAE